MLVLAALSGSALAIAGDSSSARNSCPASCSSCSSSCPVQSCGVCK